MEFREARHDHPLEFRRRQFKTASKCSAGQCVEVSLNPLVVLMRDSKLAGDINGSPIIEIERSDWEQFVEALSHTETATVGQLIAERLTSSEIVVSSKGTLLRFDNSEWQAFLNGVRAGEFSTLASI